MTTQIKKYSPVGGINTLCDFMAVTGNVRILITNNLLSMIRGTLYRYPSDPHNLKNLS